MSKNTLQLGTILKMERKMYEYLKDAFIPWFMRLVCLILHICTYIYEYGTVIYCTFELYYHSTCCLSVPVILIAHVWVVDKIKSLKFVGHTTHQMCGEQIAWRYYGTFKPVSFFLRLNFSIFYIYLDIVSSFRFL